MKTYQCLATRVVAIGRTSVAIATASVALLSAGAAQAQLMFDFDYTMNTPGVGFLDPGQGAARQAALAQAGMLYSNLFGTYFSNSGTLKMQVTSVQNPATPTLASAGTFVYGPDPGFGNGESVRQQLIFNNKLGGPTAPHGVVDVNFGYAWELNPATPAVGPGVGQTFDFFAAMFHEFTHALGFANTINLAGTDGSGDGTNGTAGTFAKYDSFLVNAGGSRIIDSVSFLTNTATWQAARTSGVFFDGPNAKAANGGNAVDLYSPNPYSNGSSIGHLNTANPAYFATMMKHNRNYGPEPRDWTAIEVGIMQDLGYTRITPIPEPATVAMMCLGLLGVAGAARCRGRQG